MNTSQIYVQYFPAILIYLFAVYVFSSMYVRLPLLAWFGFGVLFAFEVFAFWWMRTERLSMESHNVLFFSSIAVAIAIVLGLCCVWNRFMGRNLFFPFSSSIGR